MKWYAWISSQKPNSPFQTSTYAFWNKMSSNLEARQNILKEEKYISKEVQSNWYRKFSET
jgi:hypothetical protein